MVGKYMIEQLAGVPCEVDLASEFRYRHPILDPSCLVVPVSQSGETADTLAALREGREHGARVLAITNTRESSIARESDDVLYTHAGPEIGVASTKCFMSQLVALYLLALKLAAVRGRLGTDELRDRMGDLLRLPRLVEETLDLDPHIQEIAHKYFRATDFLFLGRGIMFPIALEGALKLKEISYIHAEAYAAGEMKHGPIALIDENMPVVVIANRGPLYDKVISNLEQVRARDGQVIAIATRGRPGDRPQGERRDLRARSRRVPDAGPRGRAAAAPRLPRGHAQGNGRRPAAQSREERHRRVDAGCPPPQPGRASRTPRAPIAARPPVFRVGSWPPTRSCSAGSWGASRGWRSSSIPSCPRTKSPTWDGSSPTRRSGACPTTVRPPSSTASSTIVPGSTTG